MVECGICLEEYQESDLELHREMCVVRMMFRCSLCNGDYVSKEGLWNHLDLHEIVDESKELHSQEIKIKHKLHQCDLCNDQRVYSESCYWRHVQDAHDGFSLRCSDCGENFRSEKLQNDHASSRCKAMDETMASNFNTLEEESVPIKVENTASDGDHLKLLQSLVDLSNVNDAYNNIIDKESELPTVNSTKSTDLSRFACDICGTSFSSKAVLHRHQWTKFACKKQQREKCPLCRRYFLKKEYPAHFSFCQKKKCSCALCPMKFRSASHLARHVRSVHRGKGDLQTAKQDQTQVKNIVEKTLNSPGKTCTRAGNEMLVSGSDTSSSSNYVEDPDISTAKKDIEEKSVLLLDKNPSSASMCSQCGKECVSARNLLKHIAQTHHPIKCNICGVTRYGYSSARHHKVVKHSEPKHECAKCSKKFYCLSRYKNHSNVCYNGRIARSRRKKSGKLLPKAKSQPIVEAENPLKCSLCGIVESSAVTLARHILIHHDSPVACDLCGITLPSLFQAQHHMKKKHKESKVKCPHCSTQFSWTVRLQSHILHCKDEIVPCEYCGKMYKNVLAVSKHKSNGCPAYKKSKEQKRKNAGTSLADGGFLSQTKCDFCIEKFPSPGHLIHHLKISHKLTKCDTCGITVIGLSAKKNHKIKCHLEPKHKCATCGKKFHRKLKFDAHIFACEHKVHLCTLCGLTIKKFNSIKRHNKRYHPNEISLENIQTVQDQKQAQNNYLKMKITSEETTISVCDDQGQSTVSSCSKGDFSDSRSNRWASLKDDDFMDSVAIDKEESPAVSVSPLNGGSERQVVAEEISQSLIENPADLPYSCNICGITLARRSQIKYHKRTRHTEGKFQCPHCSRKFHFKNRLEDHAICCADLKYSCDLCGQKFNIRSRVEKHKKRDHDGNNTVRDANIDGTECHLEIKVEETTLQEQEYQVPCEEPERSFASALHPHGGKSENVEAETAAHLDNEIKVKEEYLED